MDDPLPAYDPAHTRGAPRESETYGYIIEVCIEQFIRARDATSRSRSDIDALLLFDRLNRTHRGPDAIGLEIAVSGPAAVDVHYLTGHESGRRTRDEYDCGSDLLYRTHASLRGTLLYRIEFKFPIGH